MAHCNAAVFYREHFSALGNKTPSSKVCYRERVLLASGQRTLVFLLLECELKAINNAKKKSNSEKRREEVRKL